MALPACRRCGKTNPQRMHGLMTLWFGPLVDLEADLGYFYLCPACHDEFIVPELERIQNRILELHPAAARHFEELEQQEAAEGTEAEAVAGQEPVQAADGEGGESVEGGKRDGDGDDSQGPASEDGEGGEDAGDAGDAESAESAESAAKRGGAEGARKVDESED